jgi:short-subunit dehydrogenase
MRALDGAVALVTGASSGIGAATAKTLSRQGARVVLAARRCDRLCAQQEAIVRDGGNALGIPADLADRKQAVDLVQRAEAAFGPVDVLINNAGAFWDRAVVDTELDDLASVLDLNLLAPMLLTRAVLPGMLERGAGTIVFVGSLSGRVAMEPVYSASKYGVRGYALALRRQLVGTGVAVSLVSPGNIRTEMTDHIPGRLPEPEIVAEAICDLVRRPRREVIVPRRHHVLAWLEQAAPALADVAHRRRHWSPVPAER